MEISICIVIPFYNHGDKILEVLSALQNFELPCFLIDDGSDASSKLVLSSAEKKFSWVRLHRLPENLGKGGAVMAGLRLAQASGLTHAIQMDADGQHCAADVPRFVKAIQQNPQALVLGVPKFGAEVPKGRLYGRLISCFFVWLETLSFSVQDPLCGFRAYPLDSCLKLLDQHHFGRRMDFDVEIVVRFLWRGVTVISLDTPVSYFKEGVSHFHLWADNCRISWLHTRLVFGMIFRVPILMLRLIRRGM